MNKREFKKFKKFSKKHFKHGTDVTIYKTHTAIGMVYNVRCICGKLKDLTDYRRL